MRLTSDSTTLSQSFRKGKTVFEGAIKNVNDPFLRDAVHSLLTQVTAIRSSAQILQAGDGLDAARRARFVAIVDHESARVAEVARSLAAFFDKDTAGARSATPAEEDEDDAPAGPLEIAVDLAEPEGAGADNPAP